MKIIEKTIFENILMFVMNVNLVTTKMVFFEVEIDHREIKCGG